MRVEERNILQREGFEIADKKTDGFDPSVEFHKVFFKEMLKGSVGSMVKFGDESSPYQGFVQDIFIDKMSEDLAKKVASNYKKDLIEYMEEQ